MAGQVLSQFQDFSRSTGSAIVKSPSAMPVNMAGLRTYLWPKMFSNNGFPVQGGADIKRKAVWRDNGTYEKYLPGGSGSWQNPQRLDDITAQWRFTRVHETYVDQEFLLNDKIMSGTEDVVFEQFVKMRDEKEQIMFTAQANGMEADLFAQPDKTRMEGTVSTADSPYSIWPFVNEHANGLFPSYTPGGAWTVIEGVDPTAASVNGQFTPQQQTYTTSAQDAFGNIISGLDQLFMKCAFEAPERFAQYFEDPVLNNLKIRTSLVGRSAYMTLCRGGQDRFIAGNQDPSYPDPQFHGVPIGYSSQLDTAVVYPNAAGTALVTERAATGLNIGPRFLFLNCNYLYPIFHKERFMQKGKWSEDHTTPDTHVLPVTTWWNLVCWSRKHQGILSPDDTAGGLAAYA